MATNPKYLKIIVIIIAQWLIVSSAFADQKVINGDSRPEEYLHLLVNKKVAVFANSASMVESKNIVDFLLDKGIKITKIFTPEHGFNGLADAGAKVANSHVKNHANIQIISLYGTKTKPDINDLTNVNVIVFDIQDVGVRYYTYISSLQNLMEAATTYNKPLIILDRANPNGFYIDGPVLIPDAKYKSFVGMQPVPIVYGMTIGEYALMLKGEEWLNLSPKSFANRLNLTIIPVKNYTHQTRYQLSQRPSPNLPDMRSIYLYPSLGWFEGTKLSVGRGTSMPFQVFGSPLYSNSESANFRFKPVSTQGALNPPFKNQLCYGWDLRNQDIQELAQKTSQINLSYLINAYKAYPDKANFFTPFFDKLAGTDSLRQQIIENINESTIRSSWQPGIDKFKLIRKKYLIYPES